jgi:hypothetical protein
MWWLTQLSCRAHPLAHASRHRPLQLVRACVYSMLHAACCMLRGVCCMLSVACCPLHVVRCMLSVACCPLHVVRCMLSVACCPLHVVRCMLSVAMAHAACFPLHVVRCNGARCMFSVACCPLQWRMLHAVQVRARSVGCADRARVVAASRGERQCVLRGGAHADVAVALARVPPQPRPSRRIEPQRTAPARLACSAQRTACQPYHAACELLSVPCACSRTAYVTGDDHEPRPVTLLCFYTFGEPRSGIPRGTARAMLRSP